VYELGAERGDYWGVSGEVASKRKPPRIR